MEAVNRKIACDGIGGTSKRVADEDVRRGSVSFHSAEDHFAWKFQRDSKSIKYIYYSRQEYNSSVKYIYDHYNDVETLEE